ncbi:hypothetical protein [Kitasatospora sp. NPDC097643]|uniref:hypothetical protein n=1 Tax=Kitasatospora sp. NPDC097643 TaxID=3157230 RepID=UPI00331B4BAE
MSPGWIPDRPARAVAPDDLAAELLADPLVIGLTLSGAREVLSTASPAPPEPTPPPPTPAATAEVPPRHPPGLGAPAARRTRRGRGRSAGSRLLARPRRIRLTADAERPRRGREPRRGRTSGRGPPAVRGSASRRGGRRC